MLDRVRSAPAFVEDIGNRDAERVIAAACANLPAADPTGLIATSTQKAAQAIRDAGFAIPAMVVAAKSTEAAARAKNGLLAGKRAMAEGVAGATIFSEAPAQAARRTRPGAEVHVREVRLGLKMSQPAFVKAFGLGVATVRDWEQGRTAPDGAVRSCSQ